VCDQGTQEINPDSKAQVYGNVPKYFRQFFLSPKHSMTTFSFWSFVKNFLGSFSYQSSKIRCRLDNMESIFERYPDFQKAYDERIQVDVHAGEALYIPPFVWHYVETDELCTNFTLYFLMCTCAHFTPSCGC
jgi:hypothetical protein